MSTPIIQPTSLISVPTLAQLVGCGHVYIKREDQNPSGSHKDRALWGMIDAYQKKGVSEFVVSSSGNAAISTAYFVRSTNDTNSDTKKHEITLHIFISPNISESKLERLDAIIQNASNIHIHESKRAKSDAIKFAQEYEYQLLRTSVDDVALAGYAELGKELDAQLTEEHVAGSVDVFVPTSSGTTVQGIHQGSQTLRMHIVQTTKCNVIAKQFDTQFEPSETSHAKAIVDTIAHRKDAVTKAIQEGGGAGWVISDKELEEAKDVLERHTDIAMPSYDALLSLAGLIKARGTGREISTVVLVFTGK